MTQPKGVGLDLIRPRDLPSVTNGAVTVRQGRRWIAERRLRVFKPSGKTGPVYISLADLERFLTDHTVPAVKRDTP